MLQRCFEFLATPLCALYWITIWFVIQGKLLFHPEEGSLDSVGIDLAVRHSTASRLLSEKISNSYRCHIISFLLRRSYLSWPLPYPSSPPVPSSIWTPLLHCLPSTLSSRIVLTSLRMLEHEDFRCMNLPFPSGLDCPNAMARRAVLPLSLPYWILSTAQWEPVFVGDIRIVVELQQVIFWDLIGFFWRLVPWCSVVRRGRRVACCCS